MFCLDSAAVAGFLLCSQLMCEVTVSFVAVPGEELNLPPELANIRTTCFTDTSNMD